LNKYKKAIDSPVYCNVKMNAKGGEYGDIR